MESSGMSEMLKQRLEKISPQVFSDFLWHRGIPIFACPVCHKTGMTVPQVDVVEVGPIGYSGSSVPSATYLSYSCVNFEQPDMLLSYEYRIICKSCGFSSHFNASAVVQWLESEEQQRKTL